MAEDSGKIESVADLVASQFLELAGMLRELRDQDPATFLAVVERLALTPRWVDHLIGIERAFSNLPAPPERLHRMGWTTLQLLAPHIRPENWVELIELGETRTLQELQRILRGGETGDSRQTVELHLSDLQMEVFRRAALAHGALEVDGAFWGREEALTAALSRALADGSGGRRT